jgi:hypothetical protein
MGKILEAGHYYLAKGPTLVAVAGWNILEKIRTPEDQTLLFIDDVHSIEDVHEEERDLSIISGFYPSVDYQVKESAVRVHALEVLEMLKALSNGKRAKQNGSGKWFCSGFPITDEEGNPLCVLLDAGLTLFKRQQGFKEGINILPYFYQSEQEQMLRVIRKALPDFSMKVILFDLSGKQWEMQE